jgi:hypothetical protein
VAQICNSQGAIAMADDLLIAIIIAGFGLSGVYFRTAFADWRRYQAAERRREHNLGELHTHGLHRDEDAIPGSSTVQVEKRVDPIPRTSGVSVKFQLRNRQRTIKGAK